jgi:cell division septation protein DedD
MKEKQELVLEEGLEDGPVVEEKLWGRRALIGLISMATLGGLAMLVVYSYDTGKQVGSANSAPVVSAQEGPTRVKPKDPGGMEIPFRDKTVYGELNPLEKRRGIETLLPPSETFLNKRDIFKEKTPESAKFSEKKAGARLENGPPRVESLLKPITKPTEGNSGKNLSSTVSKKSKEKTDEKASSRIEVVKQMPGDLKQNKSVLPKVSEADPEKQNITNGDLKSKSLPREKTVVAAKESIVKNPKQKVNSGALAKQSDRASPRAIREERKRRKNAGSFGIQIAAFRSKEGAEKAWRQLSRANKDVFMGLKSDVVRVDLGTRGVWYRLRARPLASRSMARQLCGKLKARKIGCLVVRP